MTWNSGLLEGERRKAEQLANLEARRNLIVNRGRRALLLKLLAAGTATADHVRAAVDVPDGVDPRCLGSVPGMLARAGVIRRCGFNKSGRPERHASYIAVWELLNPDLARLWLTSHPDIPTPAPVDSPKASLFDTEQKPTTPTVAAAGVGL